jgi:hypothetical protein
MAYVGTPLDTTNAFQSLAGKRFNGDGSTTDFTLDSSPNSTLDIEVFVGNVRQDPNSAYTVSGTTLAFTGAPPSGTNNIYVVHQAKAVGTIDPAVGSTLDLNGAAELILDADADTTIAADTDDQIDIKIAGTDVVNITNSSSDLVVTHAVQDKDIVFKGDDGGSAITALTLDMSAGGDLTLGANANIVFPGTNVVSTNANTLDDYEEGAWTPACPNVTVAASEGKYTKVGRLVTVQGYATWPTTSDSNDIEISGLPFTINNSESGRGGAYVTYPTAGASFLVNGDGFYLLGAKNDTKFFAAAADGNTTQVNSEVSAKQFYFNGQFYTDS